MPELAEFNKYVNVYRSTNPAELGHWSWLDWAPVLDCSNVPGWSEPPVLAVLGHQSWLDWGTGPSGLGHEILAGVSQQSWNNWPPVLAELRYQFCLNLPPGLTGQGHHTWLDWATNPGRTISPGWTGPPVPVGLCHQSWRRWATSPGRTGSLVRGLSVLVVLGLQTLTK